MNNKDKKPTPSPWYSEKAGQNTPPLETPTERPNGVCRLKKYMDLESNHLLVCANTEGDLVISIEDKITGKSTVRIDKDLAVSFYYVVKHYIKDNFSIPVE